MRKPRRNHSAKFKAMVALEASTEIKATPDQAPKIDRLTSTEFWELMNGGFLSVLKRGTQNPVGLYVPLLEINLNRRIRGTLKSSAPGRCRVQIGSLRHPSCPDAAC